MPTDGIFKTITTGTHWQIFGSTVELFGFDDCGYHSERIAKILGILTRMHSVEKGRGRLVA